MTPSSAQVTGPISALRAHWPEYAMEAIELGLFMISACVFAILLIHPSSPASQAIGSALVKRGLMGLAMGLSAVAIIYSPMGQRSGAHMNPATTLTFWRLGTVVGWDAMYYIVAQFIGGVGGVLAISTVIEALVAHPAVNHVVTVPGDTGFAVAWVAEFVIAFILMSVILQAGNRRATSHYTGVCAGTLVAAYILIESPLSGMSMNPARTLGSAVAAHLWTGLWIYFTAPPLAMLAAAEAYLRLGRGRVYCAKLHHHNSRRCIFRCRFDELLKPATIENPRAGDWVRPRTATAVTRPLQPHADRGTSEPPCRSRPADDQSTPCAAAASAQDILYFG